MFVYSSNIDSGGAAATPQRARWCISNYQSSFPLLGAVTAPPPNLQLAAENKALNSLIIRRVSIARLPLSTISVSPRAPPGR